MLVRPRTQFSARFALLSLIGSLMTVAGCGYHFQGSNTNLPPEIKRIAVLPADNQTVETSLGPELTEALRSEFERNGALEVLEDADGADAVLRTKILRVDTRVKNVTSDNDVALEYDVFLTIAAELKTKTGKYLYRNGAMRASESFASTSDVVVTSGADFAQSGISSGTLGGLENRELARGQQREALSTVIEEISRKLYLDSVAADF